MTNKVKYLLTLFLLSTFLLVSKAQMKNTKVEGEATVWYTQTISFYGPETMEFAEENPFLDYRLTVTFINGKEQITIPGFYAADGNSDETSAKKGNVWQVKFKPNIAGEWNYTASFRKGKNIAISDKVDAGKPIAFDGFKGVFYVKPINPNAPGFLSKGRLVYDGTRYLKFSGSGEYFLKSGIDSPENFLAYHEFDNTPPKHKYTTHLSDWKKGDPTWKNGLGKEIIGVLNYMKSVGMNSIYFLTNNVMGDGDDTYMWTDRNERYRFDCSKLAQWEIVFEHMDKLGILMHIVTQENENQLLLDAGFTDVQRKLYYRELVARFGHHLAVNWNLGEENGRIGWYDNVGQSNKQRIKMVKALRAIDPYNHLNSFHTFADIPSQEKWTTPLLGEKSIDGLSIQIEHVKDAHQQIKHWLKCSADSAQQWVVQLDEIGHWRDGVVKDSLDPKHDHIRKFGLYGSYMAGAAGTEWYCGIEDLSLEDFRTRDLFWKQTKVASDYFRRLPFWEMKSMDELITNGKDWCFAKPEKIYVVYSKEGEDLHLDLTSVKGKFSVEYRNPMTGELINYKTKKIKGGRAALIASPINEKQDWIATLKLL